MFTHLPTYLFYLLVSTALEIYFHPLFNSHLEVGHQTSLQRDKKQQPLFEVMLARTLSTLP